MEVNMIYGYARVSTKEQSMSRQIKVLNESNVFNIFFDYKTGYNFDRKYFNRLLSVLKENDIVVITSIDRLGRNYQENINNWFKITKQYKAEIIVLGNDLLNKESKSLEEKFIKDLNFIQACYNAEKELKIIRQRQKEGIEAMKIVNGKRIGKTGKPIGRPKKELTAHDKYIIKKAKEGKITVVQACKELNMSRGTYYSLVRCGEL